MSTADKLIEESQRLREELLRTSLRLQAFAEQLELAAAMIREEEEERDGRQRRPNRLGPDGH
jgi:hypothetical protein